MPRLHALDEGRDVLDLLDAPEHLEHGLVGAAVQRPVEGADAGRDGRVRVHLRRADAADRAGGAVLLVVGVQDEQHVERPHDARVRRVLRHAGREEHRQEVLRVGELVVRVDVRLARDVAVREGAEGRHLGDEADDLEVVALLVRQVLRLGVERAEHPDARLQHPHRVGVVAEALHERAYVVVDEGVVRDLVHPRLELRCARQLAVDQQVRHLEEAALLRELLDRVPAVPEYAVVAVEVGDRASTRCRVHEGRVIGHQAEVRLGDLDLPEVGRPDGAVLDGQLVALTGPVVDDRQGLGAGAARGL